MLTGAASALLGLAVVPATGGTAASAAVRCAITSGAPDGTYGLARPWRPSSDPTAVPMLTVRETFIGSSVDTAAPYVNMSSGYPWQDARFAEYRNFGPGAARPIPGNRPQLTPEQAAGRTRGTHLGDWTPSLGISRPPA